MTDPMDKFAKAMKSAPAPRGKTAALDAAMRAFDDEFEDRRQETASPARQTSQTQPVWEKMMTYLSNNFRAALMGGASVAALSLAVLVTVRQTDAPVLTTPSAPKPAAIDDAASGLGQTALTAEGRANSGAVTIRQKRREAIQLQEAPAESFADAEFAPQALTRAAPAGGAARRAYSLVSTISRSRSDAPRAWSSACWYSGER